MVTQYPKDRYLDYAMKVFEKGQPQNSSIETSPKKDKEMPIHRGEEGCWLSGNTNKNYKEMPFHIHPKSKSVSNSTGRMCRRQNSGDGSVNWHNKFLRLFRYAVKSITRTHTSHTSRTLRRTAHLPTGIPESECSVHPCSLEPQTRNNTNAQENGELNSVI